jgi:hypothetical protein
MLTINQLTFSLIALKATSGSSFSLASIALLYLGPDSIMPIASVIAAILGVILIFWRYILSSIKKGFRFIRRKLNKDVEEELVLVDPATIDASDKTEEDRGTQGSL